MRNVYTLTAALLLSACRDDTSGPAAASAARTPEADPDAGQPIENTREFWIEKRDDWRADWKKRENELRAIVDSSPIESDDNRSAFMEMRNFYRNEDIMEQMWEQRITGATH